MDSDLLPTQLVGVTAAIEYASDLLSDAAEELAAELTWSDALPGRDDVLTMRSAFFAVQHEINALRVLIDNATEVSGQ